MTTGESATILFSGGIDSAVCCHMLLEREVSVTGLYIDYGQNAVQPEMAAVRGLTRYFQIPFEVASFGAGRHYSAGEVRGRNAFFVFAALLASKSDSGLIVAGLHAGTPYYDCSQEFIEKIDHLVQAHTDGRFQFLAPLASWSKKDVFTYATEAGIPFDITYSCEAGEIPPCGKCLSCLDRRELDARS